MAKPSVPDGYTFTGWLLNEEETAGFSVGTDTPCTGSEAPFTVTLTGRWVRQDEVSIVYTSGVPEDEMDNDSLRTVKTDTCMVGRDYTVKSNDGWTDYKRSGYSFKGWQVKQSAQPNPSVTPGRRRAVSGEAWPGWYAAGGFFAEGAVIEGISDNVTLAAVWEKDTSTPPEDQNFTVTYNGNGSTGGSVPVDPTKYADGGTVTVLDRKDLVRAGCKFMHWNTKPDGSGTKYNAGDSFKIDGSDVVLYAVWKKEGHTPASPGTGESAMLILFALAAMGISAAAAGGVIICHRRNRRRHGA